MKLAVKNVSARYAQKQRQFRWGRSKQSMLIVAGSNVHLFAWCPQLGAESYGVTLRHRVGVDWLHWRVVLLVRGASRRDERRDARGRHSTRGGQRFIRRRTLTLFELSQWRTSNGTQDRVDLKRYVRLKVSPGGRQISDG